MNETSSFQSTGGQRLVQWWNDPSCSKLQGCLEQRWTQLRSLNCSDDEMKRPHSHILPQFCTLPECYLSAHPSLPPPHPQGEVSQVGPSCPLPRLSDRKCACECPLVGSAGMNMPLHQISVIPRDINGKAKDKDKQVCEELWWFHPV